MNDNCYLHCPQLLAETWSALPPCTLPGRPTMNPKCPWQPRGSRWDRRGPERVTQRYAQPNEVADDVAEAMRLMLEEMRDDGHG